MSTYTRNDITEDMDYLRFGQLDLTDPLLLLRV